MRVVKKTMIFFGNLTIPDKVPSIMSECLFSSGFDGVVEDAEHCVTLANEIGYPVMIKVLNNILNITFLLLLRSTYLINN